MTRRNSSARKIVVPDPISKQNNILCANIEKRTPSIVVMNKRLISSLCDNTRHGVSLSYLDHALRSMWITYCAQGRLSSCMIRREFHGQSWLSPDLKAVRRVLTH